MKAKNILLILIIVVLIPEILLISYILSKYNVEIPQIPQTYTTDFVSFLLANPLFSVIVVIVVIVMFILYLTLQLS